MSFSVINLRGFRHDVRQSDDPDATEGREIAHRQAEARARMDIALARRRVSLCPTPDQQRPRTLRRIL